DVFARFYKPVTVNDRQRGYRPAHDGLLGDAGDFRLGHARIMLQFQCRKRAAFITAKPGEGDDGADIRAPLLKLAQFRRRVEIFASYADEKWARSLPAHLILPSWAERAQPRRRLSPVPCVRHVPD